MTDTLQKEKEKIQQRKQYLQDKEARLRNQERKQRTRRLIELGGLIAKAGLDHLDTKTILGGLLDMKQKETPDQCKAWYQKGRDQFIQDEKRAHKIPIIFQLHYVPESHMTKWLKQIGLTYNRFRSEWNGYVTQDVFETLQNQPDSSLQSLKS